jgi:hypothetical protein
VGGSFREGNLRPIVALFWSKEIKLMTMKLSMLAVAYLLIGGLLIAVSYQPSGPITTQKTDRVATGFLTERFAG